nr:transposase [Spirulina subsalsa]
MLEKPVFFSRFDRSPQTPFRTVQFIRNKALRLWMDAKPEDKIDKYSLNKYCAVLAKEFKFADDLNSTARQASAERAWSAISRFYDNCKKKGQPQSNNYKKARKRDALKHLRVSRQRKGFVQREALHVIKSNDFIAYEDLNVKGLVKNSKLAKSINDAAWSTFRQGLEYFGFKYGKATAAVPPHNTSQNCSNCGEKIFKSLWTRTHVCPHCGYVEDRDINAAINILKKGLSTVGHTGTHAWGEIPSGLVGYVLPS